MSKTRLIVPIAVAIHTLFVLLILILVQFGGGTDGPMAWILIDVLDFPVSFLLMTDFLLVDGGYAWNNHVLPPLFFLTVGNLWWYTIGRLVGAAIDWILGRLAA